MPQWRSRSLSFLRNERLYQNPPAASYQIPRQPRETSEAFSWHQPHSEITRLLDDDQTEAAWNIWHKTMHAELLEKSPQCKARPPGSPIWKQQAETARLTDRGMESLPLITAMKDIAPPCCLCQRGRDKGQGDGLRKHGHKFSTRSRLIVVFRMS